MNTIKPQLFLRSLATLALFPFAAFATILSFDGTEDYVATTQNLSRSWNLSGSTATVSFSDGSALSPVANYTGPLFFGAASSSITGAGTTGSNGNSAAVQHQVAGDRINLTYNIGNDAAGTKTITMGGLVYFKSASPFDVDADDAFSANVSGSSGFTEAVRWLLRDSGGDLYVSNETFATGGAAVSTGLTSTTWALLDTSGSNFHQTYGSFGAVTLSGLTGAGVYYEGNRNVTSTGTSNGTGFRVNQFAAIPEPSSVLLLLGGLGGLWASSVFRRKPSR